MGELLGWVGAICLVVSAFWNSRKPAVDLFKLGWGLLALGFVVGA